MKDGLNIYSNTQLIDISYTQLKKLSTPTKHQLGGYQV